MEKKQIFAIYSRKSKYTGKGESIENQIEICREYIRLHYGEEAALSSVVYEDEGFSGGNLRRPQFQVMMEAAKDGIFRGVVVYRLDRISRNIGDFVNLTKEFNRAGIDFISVKEQFDTGSSIGRAMMYISSVFSQLERETIGERIRDNLHELAKTGRWLGGTAPTGYRSSDVITVNIEGKQKKAHMLEEIPGEMKLVEDIYNQFYTLRSLTKVDAFLLGHGCRTKTGKEFSRFAVKAILTNPVYMIADEEAYSYLKEHEVRLFSEKKEFDGTHGIMAYNRTQQEKGKANKMKPMGEWIVAVGKHKGKIPGQKWVEIQEILEKNKSKSYRKARSNSALLSGILKCGNCGEFMRPKLGGKCLEEGERAYSYLCMKKERSHKSICAVRNADGNLLDRKLIEKLRLLKEDQLLFLKKMEKGRKMAEANSGFNRNERKANEKKIGRLVKALSVAPEGSEKYIMDQIETLNRENKRLKAEAADEKDNCLRDESVGKNKSENLKNPMTAEHFPIGEMAFFRNIADRLSVDQKRDMVRMAVKEVIWDGENAHVILFGSDYKYELPEKPLCENSK